MLTSKTHFFVRKCNSSTIYVFNSHLDSIATEINGLHCNTTVSCLNNHLDANEVPNDGVHPNNKKLLKIVNPKRN